MRLHYKQTRMLLRFISGLYCTWSRHEFFEFCQANPDLAWIRKERWEVLSEDEQEEFAPICPDFVVELLSRTDRLETIKDKMQEYIDNGAQLGWLIDPRERNVYVYRPDEEVVCLSDPETISGDPLLPNFELDVRRLWE